MCITSLKADVEKTSVIAENEHKAQMCESESDTELVGS